MSLRRSCRGRKAASAVEFAFVASVLFLFLFGVVEYIRLVMAIQLMNNAAREGARTAIVSQSTMTTTQIQGVVTNYLVGQSSLLQNLQIQVYQIDPTTGNNVGSWTSASFGQPIAVQVNGTFLPFLPSFLHMSSTMPLQARVVMYSEAD